MSSPYDYTKPTLGDLGTIGGVDSSWVRLEPLITADKLRNNFLMLLPLVSGIADPLTGKRMAITNDQLDEIIIQAVSIAEAESGLQLFPTQISEKLAFDANEFRQFGYFKLRNRPISAIQALQVVPANGNPMTSGGVQTAGASPNYNPFAPTTDPSGIAYSGASIYSVPVEWIETSHLYVGQINILPINIATTGQWGTFMTYGAGNQSAGGAFFLSILGSQPWVPAFWRVTYTTGFPDAKFPRFVNQYIGTIAAIEVLSMLAATYARSTSHSIGLDGLSQSISGPGAGIFQVRIAELEAKRKLLKGKLKAAYGLSMFGASI